MPIVRRLLYVKNMYELDRLIASPRVRDFSVSKLLALTEEEIITLVF
jgi:hypothetical protein